MEFGLVVLAVSVIAAGWLFAFAFFLRQWRAARASSRARENIVALEARTCERFLRKRAACAAAGDLAGALHASSMAQDCALDAFHVARFGVGSVRRVLA